MENKDRINIVGAGFSGLIQAFYLAEAGYPVRLFDKTARWGGLIGSKKTHGFLFEQAANAFIANKELERVAKAIGVTLVPKTKEASRRFIYRNGEMRRWPLGVMESLPLLSFFLSKKWKSPKYAPKEGETLEAWGVRTLGERQTQYLLGPVIQGIYATTLDKLDASLILQSLNRRKPRGKLRGTVSPAGGMQQWNEKMMEFLLRHNVEIETNREIIEWNSKEATIFAVDLASLREMANSQKIPISPSLLETQSASLTSVTLAYRSEKQKLQEGFGCLFPRVEGFNALGVLFNHSIFPGRVTQGASETWILNDEKMEFSQMSQTALLRYIQSDRGQLTNQHCEPDHIFLNQWPQRIPIYNQDLKEFLEIHDKENPPYLLMGNYLGDLGLSKLLFRAQDNLKKIQGGYFV